MNQAALDNLKTRRSCRSFTAEMPPHELIATVCEAGTYAPSGHSRQSPIILAVTNRELRDRLCRMNGEIWASQGGHGSGHGAALADPFYGAPVVLVVLADRSVSTAVLDGCAVLSNLLNAAHAVGLGSCWINRAKEEFESEEGQQILRDLGIEGDYVGVGHCVLGYAATEPRPARPRKEGYVRFID